MSLVIQHKQDLLLEIAKLLDKQDLKSVCLVSRTFREAAVGQLFNKVSFANYTKSLLASTSLPGIDYSRYVRIVTFRYGKDLRSALPLFNPVSTPSVEYLESLYDDIVFDFKTRTHVISSDTTYIEQVRGQAYIVLNEKVYPGHRVHQKLNLRDESYYSRSMSSTREPQGIPIDSFLSCLLDQELPGREDDQKLLLVSLTTTKFSTISIDNLRQLGHITTLNCLSIPQPAGMVMDDLRDFLHGAFDNLDLTLDPSETGPLFALTDLPLLIQDLLTVPNLSRLTISLLLDKGSASSFEAAAEHHSKLLKMFPPAVLRVVLVLPSVGSYDPEEVAKWIRTMARGIYKLSGGHLKEFNQRIVIDFGRVASKAHLYFTSRMCRVWMENEWRRLGWNDGGRETFPLLNEDSDCE